MNMTRTYIAWHCAICNDYTVCKVTPDGAWCMRCRGYVRWMTVDQAAHDVERARRDWQIVKREK